TRSKRDWSSDVCSSDLVLPNVLHIPTLFVYYYLILLEFLQVTNLDFLLQVYLKYHHYSYDLYLKLVSHFEHLGHLLHDSVTHERSEERRVGKKCRSRCE